MKLNNEQVTIYRAAHSKNLFLGFCQYGRGRCYQVATATGNDIDDVLLKARMEAFERKVSSTPPNQAIKASPRELKSKGLKFITPVWLVGQRSSEVVLDLKKRFNLNELDEKKKVRWVEGEDCYGKPTLVPVDMVYYDFPSKDQIWFSDSSGVAAHNDPEKAFELAITELVERDALMVSWFLKEPPTRIEPSSIDDYLAEREEEWTKMQRRLSIYCLKSEYGNVFLATIKGNKWPCFVSGASATLSDDRRELESTIRKAVEEAECNFEAYWNMHSGFIMPEDCMTPFQHGLLYCKFNTHNHAEGHIEYLEEGDVAEFDDIVYQPRPARKKERSQFIRELDIVKVQLSDGNTKVVRVFSKKLVPISFGYGNGFFEHPRLKDKGIKEIKFPHFFA